MARCTVERLMRRAGPGGRRPRHAAGAPRSPTSGADRPTDLVERDFTATAPNRLVGRGLHLRGDLVGRGLRRVRHRRLLAAGSSAGRPTPRCAPAWCSTRWRWRSGPASGPGCPPATGPDPPQRRRQSIPQLRLHPAPDRRRRRRVRRHRRRRLRQRPGRDDDRAVQDREDPPRRPLEDARRRRAGDAWNGSTGSTTPDCILPAADSPQRSSSSSIYKHFKPNRNGLHQSRGSSSRSTRKTWVLLECSASRKAAVRGYRPPTAPRRPKR